MAKRKYEPIIDGKSIDRSKYEEVVINACAASPRWRTIHCVQDNGTYELRANINCMLVKPFGTGKSSTVFDIEGPEIVNANSLSMPGLVGTITKDGRPVIGAAFRARGKLLRIDEAQKIHLKVKDAMNSIMEADRTFSRDMGFLMDRPVMEGKTPDEDPLTFGYIRGAENYFTIMSRFSCIASTMRLNNKTDSDRAFYSRFIPVRVKVDSKYMFDMARGRKKYEINPRQYEGDFFFKDYMKFVDHFNRWFDDSRWAVEFKNREDEIGYLLRCHHDVIRIGTYFSMLKGSNEVDLDDCLYAHERFTNIMFYNLLIGSLDDSEYKILTLTERYNQSEIADIIGETQSSVSKKMRILKAKGLLTRI